MSSGSAEPLPVSLNSLATGLSDVQPLPGMDPIIRGFAPGKRVRYFAWIGLVQRMIPSWETRTKTRSEAGRRFPGKVA